MFSRKKLIFTNYQVAQAWETSGPRATYGPPSAMRPVSYILSYLDSYIDYENTLNIKKLSALS